MNLSLINVSEGMVVAGAATVAISSVVCSAALWGGRKVLHQQYQKDGNLRTDLTSKQMTGLKVAGYALIVIGALAGVLAAASLSFGLLPIAAIVIFPTASFVAVKVAAFVAFILSSALLGYKVYSAGKKPEVEKAEEKLKVEKGSDLIFAEVNQYKKGGLAGCTLASIAFAASSQKNNAKESMDEALNLFDKKNVKAYLKTKKEKKADGSQSDLPFDLDDAKDKAMLKDLGFSEYEMTPSDVCSGITMEGRASYAAEKDVLSESDILKGLQEWDRSEATGAVLICAGAAIGMRKNEGNIEIFEPHGETWILQEMGKISNCKDKNLAYTISFKEIKKASEYIWKLHGKTIQSGAQSQFDLAWYKN